MVLIIVIMDQHQQKPTKRSAVKRCGIILRDERTGRCLLVQGRWSRKWGFPKGHQEEGESEEETAIRELFEETGVLVHPPLGPRQRFKNNVYFRITVDEDLIHPFIRDHNEIQRIRWFSDAEIDRLPGQECNFGLAAFRDRLRRAGPYSIPSSNLITVR